MEKDQGQEKSIEEVLMQELRFEGFDEDNLNEMVETVAGIYKGGLKAMRVLPKESAPVSNDLHASGVTSSGLQVAGIIDAAQLPSFFQAIGKIRGLGEVNAFPYGTPWPEFFRVNVNIGDRVRRVSRF